MLSVVSISDMPAAKEHGEDQNRPQRQAFRGLCRRDAQQPDLGCRIKAQAKEKAQWIHMPTACNQIEHGPEEPRKKSAIRQQHIEIFFNVGSAAAHPHKGAID
jgi:hypothetical protein